MIFLISKCDNIFQLILLNLHQYDAVCFFLTIIWKLLICTKPNMSDYCALITMGSELFSPCRRLNRLAGSSLHHWLPERSANKTTTEGRGIWLRLMLRSFLGLSALPVQVPLPKKLIFLGSRQLKCAQLTSWITVCDVLYMEKFPQQHILVRSSHIYTGGQWSGS